MRGTRTLGPGAPRVALAAVLLAFAAGDGSAQLNAESFARLGFALNGPGARAAALGGAYVAIADDATAAEVNPAGLASVRGRHLAFEMKGVEYTRTVPAEAGGGAGGREFTNQAAVPSFLAATLPLGRFTLALFRHELVSQRSTAASIGADFGGGTVLLPYTSDVALDVDDYGASVAFERGALSLGLSAGIAQLDMDVDHARYSISSYDDAFLANRVVVGAGSAGAGAEGGTGSALFMNGGMLLRLGERARIGAVARLRPAFDDVAWIVVDRRGEPVEEASIEEQGAFTLEVPDAFAIGLAVRPRARMIVALDVVLNRYSQIPANDALVFTRSASGAELDSNDYVADDGLDVRAGAELGVTVGATPLALRAGLARVAASNAYYVGDDEVERAVWGAEPDDATLRLSAGIGAVVLERIALDGAVVLGQDRRELSASLGFRF